jgi:hypothetical protein
MNAFLPAATTRSIPAIPAEPGHTSEYVTDDPMHPGEAGFAAPNFSDLEATFRDACIRATTPIHPPFVLLIPVVQTDDSSAQHPRSVVTGLVPVIPSGTNFLKSFAYLSGTIAFGDARDKPGHHGER